MLGIYTLMDHFQPLEQISVANSVNCLIFSIQTISSMHTADSASLSRRERQIMDIVYRLGTASAQEIQQNLPDPPSYSAVRALLAILVEKGALKHERSERKYIYKPTVSPDRAKRSALKRLLSTFYENSPQKLVAALLDPQDLRLSGREIGEIKELINAVEAEQQATPETP
jgi:predicted transcriptional regulator